MGNIKHFWGDAIVTLVTQILFIFEYPWTSLNSSSSTTWGRHRRESIAGPDPLRRKNQLPKTTCAICTVVTYILR